MEVPSLVNQIVTSDTIFSRDIKKTIISNELCKLVDIQEEKNKTDQKKRCPDREPTSGLDIEHILSILDRSTGRYWIWFHEQDVFENYDLEGLTKELKYTLTNDDLFSEIDDGYLRFGENTLTLIKEEILPSLI